jgi:hypothetical protein
VAKRLAKLEDLTPDDMNVNRGTERGHRMLDWSLTNLGAGRSILADADGKIIAGNKTLDIAAEHGFPVRIVPTDGKELVVVQRTDLRLDGDGEERERARLLAIADNRTQVVSYAEDAEMLLTHHAAGLDITPMYREDEIAALMSTLTPEGAETRGLGETPDENLSRFYGDGVKQLVFYVAYAQYEAVVAALDERMQAMGLDSHSEVLLKLLDVEEAGPVIDVEQNETNADDHPAAA